MKAKTVVTDETRLDGYINDGWEILSIIANPNPQPYFIILITIDVEEDG